jgi:hypothetical protein
MSRENAGFQMGRLIPHSVYSLRWFWSTQSCLYDLEISLFSWRHTKDALVLLLVRLVSKAGANRNFSLLSTKGGVQVGHLPCPLSLQWDLLPISGPVSEPLNFAVCFQMKPCLFIQEAKFLSAYMWNCAGLAADLTLLFHGTADPLCQDSCLLRSQSGLSKRLACCPPPLVSRVEVINPGWRSVGFFLCCFTIMF